MQKKRKNSAVIGKYMIWTQYHCMSREHNVTDKKTSWNFKIHRCRDYTAYPKIFIFLHCLHWYWKPPESLGCKDIWHSMTAVK